MRTLSFVVSRAFAASCLGLVLRAGEPPRDPGAALGQARAELAELLQKYSDNHPRVREQRARVAALEGAVAHNQPPLPGGRGGGPQPGQPPRGAAPFPQGPQPPQVGPQARPGQMPPPPGKPINVDFGGGTLNDLVATLAKIPDVSLNIINGGEPADLATPVPAFTLRNTTVSTVVQVLARLLGPRRLELSPIANDGNSVVALLVRHEEPNRGPTRAAPTEFESFQLGPYLGDQSVDSIVEAIRTAWELDPQHEPAALRVKFHPPTSILLVSGPRDGLSLAMKIISQLKPAARNMAETPPRNPGPPVPKR